MFSFNCCFRITIRDRKQQVTSDIDREFLTEEFERLNRECAKVSDEIKALEEENKTDTTNVNELGKVTDQRKYSEHIHEKKNEPDKSESEIKNQNNKVSEKSNMLVEETENKPVTENIHTLVAKNNEGTNIMNLETVPKQIETKLDNDRNMIDSGIEVSQHKLPDDIDDSPKEVEPSDKDVIEDHSNAVPNDKSNVEIKESNSQDSMNLNSISNDYSISAQNSAPGANHKNPDTVECVENSTAEGSPDNLTIVSADSPMNSYTEVTDDCNTDNIKTNCHTIATSGKNEESDENDNCLQSEKMTSSSESNNKQSQKDAPESYKVLPDGHAADIDAFDALLSDFENKLVLDSNSD